MGIRRKWAGGACVAILLTGGGVGCGDSGVPEPATPLTQDELLEHITYLADDSMYGRRAGYIDERRAAEYIRTEFTDAGLSPGATRYFQTFPIGPAPAAEPGPPGLQSTAPNRPYTPYSQNVLGVLPGAGDLADEWIVVGAHYDHVGWSVDPDSSVQIYNGADDNASGTSVVLAVARFLSEHFAGTGAVDSRRSILFAGFGAEEIGLIGSGYFCSNPIVPMARIAAMVNLDMVGRLRSTLEVREAGSASWWGDLVRAANTDDLPLDLGVSGKGASDHFCFLVYGNRPAVHLFTGLHSEYHTPADDPPLIVSDGLLGIAELTARLVEALVIAPELPHP